MADPPYEIVAGKLLNGEVIPFLGAGASIGKRIPDKPEWKEGAGTFPLGQELSLRLAHKGSFPIKTKSARTELGKVSEWVEKATGLKRSGLRKYLRQVFLPSCEQDKAVVEPPLIFTVLAKVSTPLLIITTNYDRLMEEALKRAGRVFDTVIYANVDNVGSTAEEVLLYWRHEDQEEPTVINPRSKDTKEQPLAPDKRTIVFKIHGSVDLKDAGRDQFVITEEDYLKFLRRHVKGAVIPPGLDEPLQNRDFLFLGYGLGDWNLRLILHEIEERRLDQNLRKDRGISSWAIQHHPTEVEERLWRFRDIELYDKPIEEFASRLEAEITAKVSKKR